MIPNIPRTSHITSHEWVGLYKSTEDALLEWVVCLVISRNIALALFNLALSSWIFSLDLLWVCNISRLPRLNQTIRMQHHQWLSMVGWRALRWITSQEEATKLNSICSLGNLFKFSLTLLVGGGQRLSPSLLTWPKKGGSGSLSKQPSRSRFHTSGGLKFPPPPPPSGISSGTKLRHKKNGFPMVGHS